MKHSKTNNHDLSNMFIFTEVVRCGSIGYHALSSFRTYHPDVPVHVFGLDEDFVLLKHIPLIEFHSLGKRYNTSSHRIKKIIENLGIRMAGHISHGSIVSGFDHGHLGTARLWAKIIKERPEQYILHFDSDVVFRDEVLSEFREKISEGYDLIGRYRNYKHNPNNIDEVRHLPDVCQTVLFAFNKAKISSRPALHLVKMCQGVYNPRGFRVIDFFDPVMFDILYNSGKVWFLDADMYGGCNKYGKRNTTYKQVNEIVDFGKKISHFSSVGSGMNFFLHPNEITHVPESYKTYAIEKYALYMKIFYNTDIGVSVDWNKYAPLFSIDRWY